MPNDAVLRVAFLCSLGCSFDAVMAALKRAEDRYPKDWPDSREHPCPAYDLAAAEAVLEQKRRARRQHDAERRIEGVA